MVTNEDRVAADLLREYGFNDQADKLLTQHISIFDAATLDSITFAARVNREQAAAMSHQRNRLFLMSQFFWRDTGWARVTLAGRPAGYQVFADCNGKLIEDPNAPNRVAEITQAG